jgi:hypothetical protein
MLAVWCNSQRLWQSVWGNRRIRSATLQHHVILGAKPPPCLSVMTGLAGEEMALILVSAVLRFKRQKES